MVETANEILLDLRIKVLAQSDRWQAKGETISRAYGEAYKRQQAKLNSIKKAIAETVRREQAMMAFMLGLMTGGLVGKLTGQLVNGLKTTIGKSNSFRNLVDEAARDHVLNEWIGKGLDELARSGTEKLQNIVLRQVAATPDDTVFSPVGDDPAVVGSLIRQGILDRTNALSTATEFIYDSFKGADLSPDVAGKVRANFLQTTFFTSLPPEDLKESVLIARAQLALWVAWGRVRDKKYWDGQHAVITSGQSEAWMWKPLLAELQALGAPATEIVIKSDRVNGAYSFATKDVTINMPGFIAWCRGQPAMTQIFNDLPTSGWGVANAQKQSATKI